MSRILVTKLDTEALIKVVGILEPRGYGGLGLVEMSDGNACGFCDKSGSSSNTMVRAWASIGGTLRNDATRLVATACSSLCRYGISAVKQAQGSWEMTIQATPYGDAWFTAMCDKVTEVSGGKWSQYIPELLDRELTADSLQALSRVPGAENADTDAFALYSNCYQLLKVPAGFVRQRPRSNGFAPAFESHTGLGPATNATYAVRGRDVSADRLVQILGLLAQYAEVYVVRLTWPTEQDSPDIICHDSIIEYPKDEDMRGKRYERVRDMLVQLLDRLGDGHIKLAIESSDKSNYEFEGVASRSGTLTGWDLHIASEDAAASQGFCQIASWDLLGSHGLYQYTAAIARPFLGAEPRRYGLFGQNNTDQHEHASAPPQVSAS